MLGDQTALAADRVPAADHREWTGGRHRTVARVEQDDVAARDQHRFAPEVAAQGCARGQLEAVDAAADHRDQVARHAGEERLGGQLVEVAVTGMATSKRHASTVRIAGRRVIVPRIVFVSCGFKPPMRKSACRQTATP